ncbi:unnamed protein product [Blepharisma stoltei]|uniref:GDT1 family protein n=1 Tax=Blepharisma stoltei TaxID=1481888 RepID=A0AAU9JRW9_9CILI|nr:unnamed protein product [Blepharisma stoltei]
MVLLESSVTSTPIEVIASSFLAIFLAEIGDRTFFVIAVLAIKNSRSAVFLGNWITISILAVIAAFIGAAAMKFIDPLYIQIASCIMFLVYSLLCFYEAYHGENESDSDKNDPLLAGNESNGENHDPLLAENSQRLSWMKAFWKTAIMVFLAEWGDKSNITIISLSALSDPILVAIGAILGFAVIGLIGVIVGKLVEKYINEKAIKIAAGVLFLIFAIFALLMIIYDFEF